MTVTEALKKAKECVNPIDIDYCVNVGNGWVIMGRPILQALYITDDKIRGLSSSVEADEKIIVEAMKKVKRGDYY